jgi:hypothetical protein
LLYVPGYWIGFFAFIGQNVLKCAFDWWCCGILQPVKFLSSSSLSCWEAGVGVSSYSWGSVHFALCILGLSRLVRVCWEYNVFLEAWPFFHYMITLWVSHSNFLCSEVYLLVDAVAYIWKLAISFYQCSQDTSYSLFFFQPVFSNSMFHVHSRQLSPDLNLFC